MAGIYIHIPFCKQACHYCNFHFSTSLQLKNDFLTALLKEIEWQRDYLSGQTVETIYFGGGTPSLLSSGELDSILNSLQRHFPVAAGAEITLESNPDDIGAERVEEWKQLGINRLSLGIQSFFEEDLQWMNRAHSADQAKRSMEIILSRISNVTVDLIYGGPTLPDAHWIRNIETVVDFGVPHVSCYALTVEPKTALSVLIEKKRKQDVDTDDQARQFQLLMERLEAAGYEHYEISNFAKPGYRSRHNSSYWSGAHYLGLGPSAHSFNGVSRQWNVANNALYIKSIEMGSLQMEKEVLSEKDRFNEYIMTSLRTMEGVDMGKVRADFGEEVATELEKQLVDIVSFGQAERSDRGWRLTRAGRLLADGIAAGLFL